MGPANESDTDCHARVAVVCSAGTCMRVRGAHHSRCADGMSDHHSRGLSCIKRNNPAPPTCDVSLQPKTCVNGPRWLSTGKLLQQIRRVDATDSPLLFCFAHRSGRRRRRRGERRGTQEYPELNWGSPGGSPVSQIGLETPGGLQNYPRYFWKPPRVSNIIPDTFGSPRGSPNLSQIILEAPGFGQTHPRYFWNHTAPFPGKRFQDQSGALKGSTVEGLKVRVFTHS